MAQEATTNEQKKFKVPRIPGDIMIYPMIVGLLLNTFCRRFLRSADSLRLPAAVLQYHCRRDPAVCGRRHQL